MGRINLNAVGLPKRFKYIKLTKYTHVIYLTIKSYNINKLTFLRTFSFVSQLVSIKSLNRFHLVKVADIICYIK